MSKTSSKQSYRVVASVAAAMFFIVFYVTPNTPNHFFDSEPVNSSTEPAAPLYRPTFTDETFRAGLFFTHTQGGAELAGLDESLGSGVCAFDYDNDGWLDIFLVGGSGQTHHFGHKQWWQKKRGNRLFRNLGGAMFEDITAQAGLENRDTVGMGCAHADLDNDGDQELLLTAIGSNVLYENNGDGTFKDISLKSGIHGSAWSTSAAIADYDGDGLLDIYIANYIKFDKHARTLENDAGYTPHPPPLFNSLLFDAEPNQLYRNRGALTFEERAESAGVDDQGGRTLSTIWLDVNHDGLPDLIVGNDKETPSRLFVNNGNGRFTPAGDQFGINNNSGFQSLASGDMNGDGNQDIIAGTAQGKLLKVMLKQGTENRSFSDQARSLGVSDTQHTAYSTWGAGIYDFNLDGTLDLMAFNGLKIPDSDAPRVSVGQSNNLWLNSNHALVDVSFESGKAFSDNISTRGAAFGDFDNDGDVDAVTVHNNNPAQLLMNQTSGQNWIGIQLQGRSDNRDAIGATVTLTTASGSQYRELSAGSGFLSDHDRRLQFGLGHNEHIIELSVAWPDGSKSHFKNLSANRYYLLKQEDDKAVELIAKTTRAEITPKLQLAFGKDNPEFRLEFLKWLATSDNRNSAPEIANTLTTDPDPSIRARAIELLREIPFNLKTVRILATAINDPTPEVRVATIHTLKILEDENTIYWLLRSLHDADTTVRIATAETFEYFFREEEAMVNKKQLAIPHLIALLEDPAVEVRAAAARALGETESYRGVMPLIQLAQKKDENVQVQAIRSLGLLRETEALEVLRTIASSDGPAIVKAHAFIALKRLGNPEAIRFIESELAHNSHISSSTATLLALLLSEEDGRVFERDVFLNKLLGWVKRQNINPAANAHALFIALCALKGISGKNVTSALLPFTDSKHEAIRKCAYEALLNVSDNALAPLISKAISDPLTDIQNLALEAAIKHHARLSAATLLRLLNRTATTKNASRLLQSQLTENYESRLNSIANDQDKHLEIRLAALSALSSSQTSVSKENLKKIMFNVSEKPEIRSQALHSLSAASPGNADLIKLTHLRHDPLSREALSVLATQNNKYAINLLRRTLNNANEKEGDRAFAATILYPLQPQETMAALTGVQP